MNLRDGVPHGQVVDPRSWFYPTKEPHGYADCTRDDKPIPDNADETTYVYMVVVTEGTPGNGQTPGDGLSDSSWHIPTPAEVAAMTPENRAALMDVLFINDPWGAGARLAAVQSSLPRAPTPQALQPLPPAPTVNPPTNIRPARPPSQAGSARFEPMEGDPHTECSDSQHSSIRHSTRADRHILGGDT